MAAADIIRCMDTVDNGWAGRRANDLCVLHIVPHLGVGGADQAVLDLLVHADQSIHSDLVVTEPAGNEWLPRAQAAGARVWNLPDLLPARFHAPFLLSLIAENRYDVIQVMNSRLGFDLASEIVASGSHAALIAHLHGEEPDRGGFPRYVAGLYPTVFTAFCVSSAALAERLRFYGVDARRIRVIHAGIDTERYVPSASAADAEAAPTLLFPARLAPEKDPLLFVDTIAALRERGVTVSARMLGGPMIETVRRHVGATGLADRITVLGSVADMRPEYARADAVVLTSRTEGIPLALLEAMSCGLPVVAPDVGSVAEVVDGRVGALVERRSAAGFANALEPLLRDASLRRRLGHVARARVVDGFSVERGARHFERLYRELVIASDRTSTA